MRLYYLNNILIYVLHHNGGKDARRTQFIRTTRISALHCWWCFRRCSALVLTFATLKLMVKYCAMLMLIFDAMPVQL